MKEAWKSRSIWLENEKVRRKKILNKYFITSILLLFEKYLVIETRV